MNDDEVKQWLTADERADFDALSSWTGVDDAPAGLTAFYALAETRKALWSRRPASYETCSECGDNVGSLEHGGAHSLTCIFATMPRPR